MPSFRFGIFPLSIFPLRGFPLRGFPLHGFPLRRFPLRRSALGLAAASLLLLASASPVLAQAALDVIVLDRPSGRPVPGIQVTVDNPAIGFHAEAATSDQGRVRFNALSTAGRYSVAARGAPRYNDQSASDIVLRTNFDRSVTLALAPLSTAVETVQVRSGAVSGINTVNAEVSSTLTQNELQSLPIEGRDITRSLYRLPNVTQATGFYPEAPNVSINGANSLYVNYMIDGLDNNENFLGGQKFAVPLGFAQDVTVLSNNYSTEFGRTGNGIFNVTSRSGSNTPSGEVFYLMRPGPSLDASSALAQRDLSGNAVKDGFRRDQGGFALGGPIVKDRTFYYVNAEYTRDRKDNLLTSPDLDVNETVPGTNSFLYVSGKINQQWTPDFASTFRLNVGDVTIERQGGGLDGGVTFPSAANAQDRNSILAAVSNKYTASRWISETNLQYGRFRWDYGRPENGDGPQTAVVNAATDQLIALLGHPGFVFDDLEESVQFQQKLLWSFDRHVVKAGAELISSDFALEGGGNVDGNYTVRLTQPEIDGLRKFGSSLDVEDIPSSAMVSDYNVELRTKSFGKRQNVTSLYAEDTWSALPELTLTFGLRWDYDNLSKGGSDGADTDNFAPRFAFNWRLSERDVIRGGAGIFYEKILYALYSDALQQGSDSVGFRSQIRQLVDKGILPKDTDIGRVTFPGNVSAGFSSGIVYLEGPKPEDLQGQRELVMGNELRILNPDGYKNPYTEQFSLGYQRQFAARTLFYVDLVRTQSYDLFRLKNLNAPSPYKVDPDNVVARDPMVADATRPVAEVPGGAKNIVMTETAGQSRYYALNATLEGDRAGRSFGYRVSYTLSRLRNNTEDINFRAQDANNFDDEWGPSINDRTHVLSGVFDWYPLDRLTLSLAGLLQSGQPVNRIPDATKNLLNTTDLNGDGQFFGDAYVGNSDRSPGESRNSDRLPWSKVFDLGASYRFGLPKGSLELRADIFNLFNSVNLSGYSNNATQSNQIQIGPPSYGIERKNAGPPRQFQFGLRYAF